MASPREIFTNNQQLQMKPQSVAFYQELQAKGLQLLKTPLTIAELVTELKKKILGTTIE